MPTPTTTKQANERLMQPRTSHVILEIELEARDMSMLDKAGLLAFILAPQAVKKCILREMRKRVKLQEMRKRVQP